MVVVYAIAMAWVESAVVFYLRTMIDRIEPYQPDPFPVIGGFASIELPREFATLVMLFAVGLLAGRTWRARIGYAAIAFGVWDIFYYVFLKMMCDWPHSLLDWDILFLLPLPWWGPVLAPVLILPLFNKFTPLPDGSLRDRLLSLATRSRFQARSVSGLAMEMTSARRAVIFRPYFTRMRRSASVKGTRVPNLLRRILFSCRR